MAWDRVHVLPVPSWGIERPEEGTNTAHPLNMDNLMGRPRTSLRSGMEKAEAGNAPKARSLLPKRHRRWGRGETFP